MKTRFLPLITALLVATTACTSTTPDDTQAVAPTTSSSTTTPSSLPLAAPTTTPVVVVDDTTSNECETDRYTVTVPVEWSVANDCTVFSPFEIPEPGEREYRSEIDLFFTTSETYGEAFDRVNADYDVTSFTTFYIDGAIASVFKITEEWYAVGERTVYVVDAGDGVLFASANELIDTEPVADLADHYDASVETLNEMMATASIVFVG